VKRRTLEGGDDADHVAPDLAAAAAIIRDVLFEEGT
jgi:hypothetical protein